MTSLGNQTVPVFSTRQLLRNRQFAMARPWFFDDWPLLDEVQRPHLILPDMPTDEMGRYVRNRT
jgi:hypothetical protein